MTVCPSTRRCFSFAAAAMALGPWFSASAAEHGPLHDRFAIDLGTYWMNSDTNIRADSIRDVALGTSVNLEDTFGFDEETVFRIEGSWRFHKRHKLRAMYFDSERTATEEIEERISFAGEEFPIGIEVQAEFDFRIIELAYEYDFLHRESYEMGASIGIHNVDFATSLAATISVPGTSLTERVRGEVDTEAPLPVIGLRGNWNFAGDFYLQAHAQYFSMKYEDYDGAILDLQAGVLWKFSRHFGIGLAYNLFDAQVDIDDGDDFQGRLDWEYYGAQAYVRASF